MNKILLDFYRGKGEDYHDRTLYDMLNMTDEQLEKSHDVIQWMFPLNELSAHNRAAPILDAETIDAMKHSLECQVNLEICCSRILTFLKPPRVERPFWIRPGNHNYLRMTRIIKCCKLLGHDAWAEFFYKVAMDLYEKYPKDVGRETANYWTEALQE